MAITKTTIKNLIDTNYRTYWATFFPTDDFDSLKNDATHFAAYMQSIDSTINTTLAQAHFWGSNSLPISAVVDPTTLAPADIADIKTKYAGFVSFISTYVDPADHIDTFKHFLEKNGVADLTKTTELTALYSAVTSVVATPPPAKQYVEVNSRKNHPVLSWLGKKVGISAGLGYGSFLITKGILNAQTLAAGEKFMGMFTVADDISATASTIGSVVFLTTPVIAYGVTKLKDVITRQHYKNKYGSYDKVIAGEKDLKVLMDEINKKTETLLDLEGTKNPFLLIKRYFLLKQNRNALHHVANATKAVIDTISTCNDPAQVLRMKKFVSTVYKFAETNLNLGRKKYATLNSGSYLSENVDIFAKLGKYCDDLSTGKKPGFFDRFDMIAKRKRDHVAFYTGVNDLVKYTDLTEAELDAMRNIRLAILPENDALDESKISGASLTDPQHEAELKKNRKEGLTPNEFDERISFFKNMEKLLADSKVTGISDPDHKAAIEKLIKSGNITKLEEIDPKLLELNAEKTNKENNLQQAKQDYFDSTYGSLPNEVKTILANKVNADLTNPSKTLDDFKSTCTTELPNALKEAKEAYANAVDADIAAKLKTILSTQISDSSIDYDSFKTLCDSKLPSAVIQAKETFLNNLYSATPKKISTDAYNTLLMTTTNGDETYDTFKLNCQIEVNKATALVTRKMNTFNANKSTLTTNGVAVTVIDALEAKAKDPDILETDFDRDINSLLLVRPTGLVPALTNLLKSIKAGTATSKILKVNRITNPARGTTMSELDMDKSIFIDAGSILALDSVAATLKAEIISKYASADITLNTLAPTDFELEINGATF